MVNTCIDRLFVMVSLYILYGPSIKMVQAPSDADLDYGFESDELDTRYDSDRNAHPHNTIETRKFEDTEEKGVIGNMSSWLQRQAGSSQGQLATTAVISGAAVAGAIFGYQSYKRKEAVHDLKASIPNIDDSHPAGKVSCIAEAAHSMLGRLRKNQLICKFIAY
jgi:hypothetical protein